MIGIQKSFYTETAHIVRGAVSQRCKYNIHGHSYKWVVDIGSAVLNTTGMVMDFKQLKFIKQFIDKFDHSCVLWKEQNPDIIQFFKSNFKRVIIMTDNPTAQNMAILVFSALQEMIKEYNQVNNTYIYVNTVTVWQTKDSCAKALYSRDNYKQLVQFHQDNS